MISKGAEVDQPDDRRADTRSRWAAAKGRVDNIKLLAGTRRARVNAKSSGGFTPLFFALKSQVPDAPMAMLGAGADPDYVALDGTSVGAARGCTRSNMTSPPA